MQTYQTILIGATLDDRDPTTLAHAALIARTFGVRQIYLAHVTPSFDLGEESLLPVALPRDEAIEQKLQTLLAPVRSSFPEGAAVHVVAREGALNTEFLRLAVQKSADLICLGRRPAGEPDRLSSTALQLVRKAPCSVLVVPPGSQPRYDRLLVPVDFSDHSRIALEVAGRIARAQSSATVTVQHTYDVPLGWHKSSHSYEEFAAIMRRHAENRWSKFATEADLAGVNCQPRFDLNSNIPAAILATSDEIQADLIVLGSHGRTQPAALLLGHVADVVCASTPRPVLCVKRKGEVVNFLRALLQLFDTEGS